MDSLIAEREFLTVIRKQVARRGGKRLPIEDRMERSVRNAFSSAGLEEPRIPSRRSNGWPSAQERIALLGPTAYSAYRTGSGSLHGAWYDLVRNHLEEVGPGMFAPDFVAAAIRPQPLFMMAIVSADCALSYIEVRFQGKQNYFAPGMRGSLPKLVIQIRDTSAFWLIGKYRLVMKLLPKESC